MAKRTGDIELAGVIATPAGGSQGVAGEDLSLTAGSGNATSGSGGSVTITAGAGVSTVAGQDGGNITLTSGVGSVFSGTQLVDVGGSHGGGDATGLTNDATVYTASIVVDGGSSQPIAITGSTAQSYTTLLSELNTDTTGAVWSLSGGNLLATSSSSGASSTIAITDTDLFSSITGFVAVDAAIAAGSPGAIVIPDQSAPNVTANKLYSVGGNLIWNGIDVNVGAFANDASDNLYGGTGAAAAIGVGATGNFIAGQLAGARLTTGDSNVFVGIAAGRQIVTANLNIAIGASAMGSNSGTGTGTDNIAIGQAAMDNSIMTTAAGNIAIGVGAMNGITSGDTNVALGSGAGDFITTGDDNVMIGRNAGPTANQTSRLYISSGAGASDTPMIGGNFATGAVELSGTVRFTERADHIGTPTATFGELWVRNDTPNVLVFTDDAGTDTVLGIGDANLVDTDGDTSVNVETTADDDRIRFNTGSKNGGVTGYPAATDVMTLASGEFTVALPTANVAAAIGAPISMAAGDGGAISDGGLVSLTGGDGGATGTNIGGAVTLLGGVGGTAKGDGGAINLTGGVGSSTSSDGGAINITAGASAANDYNGSNGGWVNIKGGAGFGVSDAGRVEIYGGDSADNTNSAGGQVRIIGGSGPASVDGGQGGSVTISTAERIFANTGIATGTVNINTGNAGSGGAGDILLGTGGSAVSGGTGGLISLNVGLGNNAVGSPITLDAGDGHGAFGGGNIELTSGSAGTAGDGGSIILDVQSGGGAGADGTVSFRRDNVEFMNFAAGSGLITTPAGAGAGDTGQALTLTAGAGNATSGDGGAVSLIGGAGGTTSGNGGAVNITGGGATGNGEDGGSVSITGGYVNATGLGETNESQGGSVTILGGSNPYNDTYSSGGNIDITAGAGGGLGGDVTITGGANPTATGNSGFVHINGGEGGAVAGEVELRGGDGASGRTPGNVQVYGGRTGSGGTSNAGLVSLYGGAGYDGFTGGEVRMLGGSGTQGTGGGDGGYARVEGGVAGAGGTGGYALLKGGVGGSNGDGGDAQVYAGNAGAGAGYGGDLILSGGNGGSTSGDSGDIVLTPGTAAGSGSQGAIQITATTAPDSTTNKLYNVAGALTWNGIDLTAGPTTLADADGDTSVNVEVSADDDRIRFDTGSLNGGATGFPAATDVMILGSGSLTVAMPTATTASQTGAPINLTAGQGGATGYGGAVFIQAGAAGATSGYGGAAYMYGGAGSGTYDGGGIFITGGNGGVTGGGAPIQIKCGDGGATSGSGGDFNITGGNGDVGGDVVIQSGNGDTTDDNGNIIMWSGTAGTIETLKGYKVVASTGAAVLVATIPIPLGATYVYELFAVAREDSGGGTESAAFRIFGAAENTSGTVSLVGSSAKDRTDDGGASVDWDVTMGVSTSNLTITIDNDAETVGWKFKIRFTDII